MTAHDHDNLPVHMRSFTDPDTGTEFVQLGVEIEGVFHPFQSVHAAEFDKVDSHLRHGVPPETSE